MIYYLNRVGLIFILFSAPFAAATTTFINEFHYDNTGADINEGIEIAASAGTDLGVLRIVLYNGLNGMSYAESVLKGVVPDQHNGFGTLYFAMPGIQNGPDGIALVTVSGDVLQFLSYEGSFTAIEGVAAGITSIDIGVSESPDSDLLSSLQLSGSGVSTSDFSWTQAPASPGLINTGQVFTAPVPLPGTMLMMLSAVAGLLGCRCMPLSATTAC